jgi:hypothetical protein
VFGLTGNEQEIDCLFEMQRPCWLHKGSMLFVPIGYRMFTYEYVMVAMSYQSHYPEEYAFIIGRVSLRHFISGSLLLMNMIPDFRKASSGVACRAFSRRYLAFNSHISFLGEKGKIVF